MCRHVRDVTVGGKESCRQRLLGRRIWGLRGGWCLQSTEQSGREEHCEPVTARVLQEAVLGGTGCLKYSDLSKSFLFQFIKWIARGLFPGGASGKELTCQCRRCKRHAGSIPGLRRSPGEGHGYPFQYSCLENPLDRGAWQATVHGVAKSQTQLKQLSIRRTVLGSY